MTRTVKLKGSYYFNLFCNCFELQIFTVCHENRELSNQNMVTISIDIVIVLNVIGLNANLYNCLCNANK